MRDNLYLLEKVIFNRRSCRSYSDKKVNPDHIHLLLNAANAAPKAGGIDCITVLPITDESDRSICYKASFYQEAVSKAPLILMFCGNLKQLSLSYKDPFLSEFIIQNAAVSAMNVINACQILSLDTCYIGGIREDVLMKHFQLDEHMRIITLILVGNGEQENGK